MQPQQYYTLLMHACLIIPCVATIITPSNCFSVKEIDCSLVLCVQLERALFEDVYYYMHYCMGSYGWSLHVFQNPITGLFSLGCATWYGILIDFFGTLARKEMI